MNAPTLAKDVSPRTRGLFLKNLADFQTELARIHAGFLPALEVWEQRKELPMLIFRSFRRVQDLRIRGRELGVSFADMHHSEAAPARELLEALAAAPTVADLFQAGMIEVPAVLIAAIDDYLKRNDNVYDLPSVPLLEADRDDFKSLRQWAEAAFAVMAEKTALKPDPAYVQRVTALAADLATTLQEHAARSAPAVRQGRRIGRLPLLTGKLPQGFRLLEFGPEPMPKENDYSHRERYHAINFLQEVQASDSCASLLFDAPDMPWDFYFDLSRHMWDESRHSMFGEKKLIALGTSAAEAGLSDKAYAMRQTLAPHDRYAALITQEADAFPGKHRGLKDAVDHNDNVSAMAWSYDIADETQHVRFGNKWLPVMIEKIGEPRSFEQVKTDACNWRVSVLAEVYKPAGAALKR
ncbi:MAG: DUF455 family protein [Verrucomicrobiota bacterium]